MCGADVPIGDMFQCQSQVYRNLLSVTWTVSRLMRSFTPSPASCRPFSFALIEISEVVSYSVPFRTLHAVEGSPSSPLNNILALYGYEERDQSRPWHQEPSKKNRRAWPGLCKPSQHSKISRSNITPSVGCCKQLGQMLQITYTCSFGASVNGYPYAGIGGQTSGVESLS